MIIALLVWVLKSAIILVIFQFVLPIGVHGVTRNSWVKLPIMVVIGFAAGLFMAWLHYVPYILIIIWLLLNKNTLAAMCEPRFESEAAMSINKPVFYLSTYLYIITACVSAWLFQIEVVYSNYPSERIMPLWKHLLGLD